MDLRHQTPVGGRVDLEEGNLARGERAGLGGAQLDLGGDGGEDVARRTRQQRAVLEPGHTQAEPMSPVDAAEGEMTGGARPRQSGIGKAGGGTWRALRVVVLDATPSQAQRVKAAVCSASSSNFNRRRIGRSAGSAKTWSRTNAARCSGGRSPHRLADQGHGAVLIGGGQRHGRATRLADLVRRGRSGAHVDPPRDVVPPRVRRAVAE